jgi:hypothetical protein
MAWRCHEWRSFGGMDNAKACANECWRWCISLVQCSWGASANKCWGLGNFYNRSCHNWSWPTKIIEMIMEQKNCSFCSKIKTRWTCYKTCWDRSKWHFYLNLQSIAHRSTIYLRGWVGIWGKFVYAIPLLIKVFKFYLAFLFHVRR